MALPLPVYEKQSRDNTLKVITYLRTYLVVHQRYMELSLYEPEERRLEEGIQRTEKTIRIIRYRDVCAEARADGGSSYWEGVEVGVQAGNAGGT